MFHRHASLWMVALVIGLSLTASRAAACPFCSAVSLTFSEEMAGNDVAVIAKLIGPEKKIEPTATSTGERNEGGFQDEVTYSLFSVQHVLKNSDGFDSQSNIRVLYFGKQKPGTSFLILGTEPPKMKWSTPIPLSAEAVAYMRKLPSLPESGAQRLVFFQEHLENEDELLSRDAYDEFAKAPYSDVKALGPQMKREELIQWIKDPKIPSSRTRLYLTMLGVCGQKEDADMLEKMLTSESDEPRTGLDATIACYLTLKGPSGMKLVEDQFLANKEAEYTDTYAAIMALRFHGQEEEIIPRKRLLIGLRHMLDRPELADLVIPDLARWEDWSAMDRLAKLFKEADEKSSWVRVPVVQYLKACPLPKAEKLIKELEKVDPESVKRASFLFPGGGAPKPAPKPEPKDDEKAAKESSNKDDKSNQSSAKAPAPQQAPALKKSDASTAETSQRSPLPAYLGLGLGLTLMVLGLRGRRITRTVG